VWSFERSPGLPNASLYILGKIFSSTNHDTRCGSGRQGVIDTQDAHNALTVLKVKDRHRHHHPDIDRAVQLFR